jgi:hypothetical protein
MRTGLGEVWFAGEKEEVLVGVGELREEDGVVAAAPVFLCSRSGTGKT